MAFKMKGHSLPGPYQKKGDPKKPKRIDKDLIPIDAQPIVTAKEKKAAQDRNKATGQIGYMFGKVDPRKKDPNKSLKRPLKKKGDPKRRSVTNTKADMYSDDPYEQRTVRKGGKRREVVKETTIGLTHGDVKKDKMVTKYRKDGSVKSYKTKSKNTNVRANPDNLDYNKGQKSKRVTLQTTGKSGKTKKKKDTGESKKTISNKRATSILGRERKKLAKKREQNK